MKYKLLLIGSNKIMINEFFTYMDFSFKCMTSSMRYDDMVNHIELTNLDAVVYCMQRENGDDIKRFSNVEDRLSEKKIPIFIVGDDEDCSFFNRTAPMVEATMLVKPITSQGIEKAITTALDKRQAIKEAKEAKEEAKTETKSGNSLLEQAAAMLEQLSTTPQSSTLSQAGTPIADAGMDAADFIASLSMEDLLEAPPKRKHILVVDDDSNVLKMIKGYLANDYDVATAINGKVAMKFLESKGTDLVLLDYEMPGENGPDVLSKIRMHEKLRKLPVVFLTGVTDKDKIQEVLMMKPQGYLLKPINTERLSATIKNLIG